MALAVADPVLTAEVMIGQYLDAPPRPTAVGESAKLLCLHLWFDTQTVSTLLTLHRRRYGELPNYNKRCDYGNGTKTPHGVVLESLTLKVQADRAERWPNAPITVPGLSPRERARQRDFYQRKKAEKNGEANACPQPS